MAFGASVHDMELQPSVRAAACNSLKKRFGKRELGQFRSEESQRGRLKVGLAPGMSRLMLLREISSFEGNEIG